jgi:L-threonylcarbamoyladenylate synthase
MGTRRRRVSVIYFISKLLKWDDLGMEIISNPTEVEIKKAAQALMDGHLVAFPTETVYGLGADATNEKAVSRVYSVKGRPSDHPLIVHISSIVKLTDWAIEIPEYATKLAEEFWPGAMTLILKRTSLAKDFITGGQNYIAIRVPDNPIAIALLENFENEGGFGVVAPSANRFGAVSPTSTIAVMAELGDYLSNSDLILDGGNCSIGIESTIIDVTTKYPIILRPGAVTSELIAKHAGLVVSFDNSKNEIRASGLLKSHYSPKAKLSLKYPVNPGDGFIALESIPTPFGAIRLAAPKTNEQYANELYAALRSGDERSLKHIIAIEPIGSGVAEAIRDRLGKASTK